MSIGIRAVSAYRPETRLDNLAAAAGLDADPAFVADKIGLLHLSRKAADQDTSDLACAAARRLFAEHGLAPEAVECLVLVTQTPDHRGLPHTSAVVHHKLALPSHCAVFDISLGCSGYVHGLAVAKAFMQAQGFRNGLLLTADPYSKIVDPTDRDTALLFGDGASATWLSDDPVWQLGPCDFGIASGQHAALQVDDAGRLAMNGRAVFNFAASQVPLSVARLLAKAGLTMADIDLALLHQGSRYIVESLAKRIGAENKAPFAATEYGNTVSSSVPMLLAEHVPEAARRLLLCGFGVGLAWATCLLEKAK
ncbi:MAG TPA: ketoacyl-ACP synthase III [Ideonella sp.]|nr:ketoacyl-ACP synthase III [Ideonella sp.]